MKCVHLRISAAIGLFVIATGCASVQAPAPSPLEVLLPQPTLEAVADNVWVHKSWSWVDPWGLVLSQGLVVKSPEGVILVDTAWTEDETGDLLETIEETLGAPVDTVIVTHAHADKMGGMATVNRRVRRSLALPLSNEDAPSRGLVPASGTLREKQVIGPVEVFYPGGGHTRDNIVVYHPATKVLFGGCLIRPGEAKDLGNTGDADVQHWAEAVEAVTARFPDAEVVIPSHGSAGGRELLEHTIELARAQQRR